MSQKSSYFFCIHRHMQAIATLDKRLNVAPALLVHQPTLHTTANSSTPKKEIKRISKKAKENKRKNWRGCTKIVNCFYMVKRRGNTASEPVGNVTALPGDCQITAAMRQQLHDRRLAAGLTFIKVGELLGVHGTTVQKWERGKTRRCNITVWTHLQQFLAGTLMPSGGSEMASNVHDSDGCGYGDGGMDVVLRRAQRLYTLCGKEGKSELGEELVRRLAAAVDAVLHKLAG